MVLRDKLVRRAISLIDSPSRSLSRRTFAYIDMVCTSSPHRPGRLQGKGKHPGQFSTRKTAVCWSIFSAPQHPAAAHRVNQQLWNARFASKRVAWLHQIHMSEVGLSGVFAEAPRLQAGYRAVYGIGGAALLAPLNHSNYTWITPPSPTYPDSGSEMFNTRVGDATNAQDSNWVGVDGSATLRVDLGSVKSLDWVGVQTLSKPSWAIRTPTTLQIYCGSTLSGLTLVGTASAPFPQSAVNSSSGEEYVLGNYSPLGASCRYVELRMPNTSWTFIGEVELSKD